MIDLAVPNATSNSASRPGLNVEDGLLRDHPHIIAKRHRLTRRPSYTCGYTSGGMVTPDERH